MPKQFQAEYGAQPTNVNYKRLIAKTIRSRSVLASREMSAWAREIPGIAMTMQASTPQRLAYKVGVKCCVLNPDELEISKLRKSLLAVEQEYAQAMRARGFDPTQDENLALPSALAKLYQVRQELRTRIDELVDDGNGEQEMSGLASRDCVPCRGGVPPLKGDELINFQSQIVGWEVVNEHHLRKEYKFKDFRETQLFINRVGDLAEEQWHHPDICFGWGYAEVKIWTHKIDGLTESDFILAAKIDALLGSGGVGA